MTPEITWTRIDPDQSEAWHMGREWALMRYMRRPNGNPAGWYLHSTLGPGALADRGRWMGGKRGDAEVNATMLLLSPEGKEIAAAAERAAGEES
jgi:hypothetical protein